MADDDVGQAVAVDIGDRDTGGYVVFVGVLPAEDIARTRGFREMPFAVVEIEAMFAAAVGEEDIGPAVVVHVGHRHRQAAESLGKPGGFGNVFELIVPLVAQEHRPRFHVGRIILFAQDEIEQAVTIEIEGGQPAAFVGGGTSPALFGNVGEFAGAVVAKEQARHFFDRIAFVAGTIGDIQIKPAAVVEIDEESAAADAGGAQMGLRIERELPLVVAQESAGFGAGVMKGGDEEIGPAGVGDIAPGRSVAANAGEVRKNAGLCADIAEHEGGSFFLAPGERGEQQQYQERAARERH